jgi:hypothetical protein
MFDYGVMINHGSTDDSVDIIKEYVPHWRLVNSNLTHFNAFMTDFEVMSYEKDLPGWKIALNTTEFLLCSMSLDDLITLLEKQDFKGVASEGHIIVDTGIVPKLDPAKPLVKQLHWGFNDNLNFSPEQRLAMNLGCTFPTRNRFFHCLQVGMYQPGRHLSYSPYSNTRIAELMVWHYLWAPWNQQSISRKMGIKAKLDPDDVRSGAGKQHTKNLLELETAREVAMSFAHDLTSNAIVQAALVRC